MKFFATTLTLLAGALLQASSLNEVNWQDVKSQVRAAHANTQVVLGVETHMVRPDLPDFKDAYTFGYAGPVAILERVLVPPSGTRLIAAEVFDGRYEWLFGFGEERVPGSALRQATFRTESGLKGALTTFTGSYRLGLALIVDLDFKSGFRFERTDQEGQWRVSGTLPNGDHVESLLMENRSWSAANTVVTTADGLQRYIYTVLDGSRRGDLYIPTRTRCELFNRDGEKWTLASTTTIKGQVQAVAQNGLAFFTPHLLKAGRTVYSADTGDEYVINEHGEPIRK